MDLLQRVRRTTAGARKPVPHRDTLDPLPHSEKSVTFRSRLHQSKRRRGASAGDY